MFGIIGIETHRKVTADIVKSESEGQGDKKRKYFALTMDIMAIQWKGCHVN